MSGWYPYDRFTPGDGDDQPIDEPSAPGRIRTWWRRWLYWILWKDDGE